MRQYAAPERVADREAAPETVKQNHGHAANEVVPEERISDFEFLMAGGKDPAVRAFSRLKHLDAIQQKPELQEGHARIAAR